MPSQPPLPEPSASFATVRVVSVVRESGVSYQIETRSRWWPFWRRVDKRYPTPAAAVEVASAQIKVADFLKRTVHEPHVVWKG